MGNPGKYVLESKKKQAYTHTHTPQTKTGTMALNRKIQKAGIKKRQVAEKKQN